MGNYVVKVEHGQAVVSEEFTGAILCRVGFQVVAAQLISATLVQVTTAHGGVDTYSVYGGGLHRRIAPADAMAPGAAWGANRQGGHPDAVHSGDGSHPADRVLTAVIWGVPLGLLVFFAPGLVIDWLFGRFKGAADGLFISAVRDGWTWLITLSFWVGLVGLIVWLCSGSGTPAPVPTPDEAESGSSLEQEAPPLSAESSTWEDVARILEQERANENEGDDGFGELCTDEACAEQLGVSGELTMEDIHRAYRQRMREYHPDRVAHLGPKLRELAELESKRLNVAYQYFVDRYGQAA